jgi:hypothetical protein
MFRPTGTEGMSVDDMRKWFSDRGMLAEQQPKKLPERPPLNPILAWLDRVLPRTPRDN